MSTAESPVGNPHDADLPLRLCLSDFLAAGDCVFDIGAGAGENALALAELVGPRGEVHAFEPNAERFGRLCQNVAASGKTNLRLVDWAPWSAAPASSLDDYATRLACRPKALRWATAGHDATVLESARSLLSEQRPVVAFRYLPSGDRDPAALLQELGYWLFDANRYEPFTNSPAAAALERRQAVNLVAVHTGMDYSPYDELALRVRTVFRQRLAEGEMEYVSLPSGRYVASVDFDAPRDLDATLEIDADDDRRIVCWQASVAALKEHTCSNMVFELVRPTRVRCRIDAPHESQVNLRSIEIRKVRM